jgi:hypothetical protein
MLTKTKPSPLNNFLKLITPRISVSVIEIELDEAKRFLVNGITCQDLEKFKKLLSVNEVRSAPIFNRDLMNLYLNDSEVYMGREALQKHYEIGLKKHAVYIGDGNVNADWYSQIDYSDNNLDNFGFSIVFDRYFEHSQQLCVLDEDFDSNKIFCQIEELYLEKNKEYLNCHWMHGKNYFRSISDGILTKEECYLFTTSSRRFDIVLPTVYPKTGLMVPKHL